jgi:hypothetical protein
MELAGYDVPRSQPRTNQLANRLASASLTETEERAIAAFLEHLLSQRSPE